MLFGRTHKYQRFNLSFYDLIINTFVPIIKNIINIIISKKIVINITIIMNIVINIIIIITKIVINIKRKKAPKDGVGTIPSLFLLLFLLSDDQ